MLPFTRLAVTAAFGLALLGAAAPPTRADIADATAGSYKIDPTHASLTWKVSHMGLSNYTARFAKLDAQLTFDPAKPEASKLTATVEPTSLKTDYPFPDKVNFDKELIEGAKWFNANVSKTITFSSTGVKMTGPKTAEVTGDLTLLGVTKPVTLNVTLNGAMKERPFAKKPALAFSASGVIKRSAFGLSQGIPVVGDDVQLLIEAEFIAG